MAAIGLAGENRVFTASIEQGRFYWLLDRVVRREGIGDILAEGTYYAAEKIGNGAEEYAHNTIKKHEQLPLKLGMMEHSRMELTRYLGGEYSVPESLRNFHFIEQQSAFLVEKCLFI